MADQRAFSGAGTDSMTGGVPDVVPVPNTQSLTPALFLARTRTR